MEFLNNFIQKIERRHIIIAIGAIVAVSLFIYIVAFYVLFVHLLKLIFPNAAIGTYPIVR